MLSKFGITYFPASRAPFSSDTFIPISSPERFNNGEPESPPFAEISVSISSPRLKIRPIATEFFSLPEIDMALWPSLGALGAKLIGTKFL